MDPVVIVRVQGVIDDGLCVVIIKERIEIDVLA